MKRFSLISLLFLMICCATARQAYSGDNATTELRAGAAAVDISPVTLPAIRNGGFLQSTADRVDDPLHARCLVLAKGQETIAICIVDSCMFSTQLCDTIKDLVTERIGLPSNRILISATHTHSAPSAMSFCLACGQDDAYVQFVAPVVAHGIVAAHARLQPAKIGWASIDAGTLTNCRRWITRSDRLGTDPFGRQTVRAMMHPGHQNPDYVGPAGPIDPQLSVLSVVSAFDDAPLCVMANFSMHYFGAGRGFSADYFGEVAGLLEAEIDQGNEHRSPNLVAIMSQGTSGDLHWMDYSQPRRGVKRREYSQAVANKVLEARKTIEHRADVTLSMAETRLKIGRRLPSAKRLQWARAINTKRGDRLPQNHPEVYAQQAQWIHENPVADVVLQAVRIGELGIAALPNEVYGITGLKLKQQSPLTSTFNLELANGGEGYIPPPEQHRLGGYTTWPARSAGLEEQAEPKIVEAVLSLLETVSGEKRRILADPPSTYSQAILEAKPVAYWRLGDLDATQVTDATGGHDAEYRGGVALYLPGPDSSAFSSGKYGNRAVHFAGGHIEAALAELSQEYSVSMWCWNGLPTDAQPITGTLFARGEGDDREKLLIGGNADPTSTGRLIFRARSLSFLGKTSLATKGWHHLTLIRTADRVQVYLDGEPEPDIDERIALPPTSSQVFIGGDGGSKYTFDGKLDEVAIFGRAFSAGAVLHHYRISEMKPPPRPTPAKLLPNLGAKPSSVAALENYAKAVIASQPAAYWRLHADDQRTAQDEMKRHEAAFEDRTQAFQPGVDLSNFTGGRVRAKVPNLGNTYSVEMWIRNELPNTARPVTGYLISRGEDGADGAPGDSLGIGGTHSNGGQLFVYNGNRRGESMAGPAILTPGSWAHVVMVRGGESVKVYVNGDTVPEIDGRLPITYPMNCEQLFVGGRNDNFANFQGMIEEVAVYDRVLQPAELKAHFEAAGAQ